MVLKQCMTIKVENQRPTRNGNCWHTCKTREFRKNNTTLIVNWICFSRTVLWNLNITVSQSFRNSHRSCPSSQPNHKSSGSQSWKDSKVAAVEPPAVWPIQRTQITQAAKHADHSEVDDRTESPSTNVQQRNTCATELSSLENYRQTVHSWTSQHRITTAQRVRRWLWWTTKWILVHLA